MKRKEKKAKLTVGREIIGVLCRRATCLQFGTRRSVNSDSIGAEESVQMRLVVLSRVDDRVDVLVHEHVDIDVGVRRDLRDEGEKDLRTHPGRSFVCRFQREK